MKITHPEKRLKKFWGLVDQKNIKSISGNLAGNNILDMGCGLGTTTEYITKIGHYNCIGIDYDSDAIEYCKRTYPQCNFQIADAEQLPFEDDYFDTIVLRDVLHHFYREADFNKVTKEILRVSKSNARIIFFDPNVNFILKTMRKISSHKPASNITPAMATGEPSRSCVRANLAKYAKSTVGRTGRFGRKGSLARPLRGSRRCCTGTCGWDRRRRDRTATAITR